MTREREAKSRTLGKDGEDEGRDEDNGEEDGQRHTRATERARATRTTAPARTSCHKSRELIWLWGWRTRVPYFFFFFLNPVYIPRESGDKLRSLVSTT